MIISVDKERAEEEIEVKTGFVRATRPILVSYSPIVIKISVFDSRSRQIF